MEVAEPGRMREIREAFVVVITGSRFEGILESLNSRSYLDNVECCIFLRMLAEAAGSSAPIYRHKSEESLDFELTASMMCADYGHLEHEVKELEAGGIDSFHIDIMDGRYVPNFAMSLNDMRYIARTTSKPPDVPLMIGRPNNNISLFLAKLRKGDIVYIHPEVEYHPSTTLQKIINAEVIPGIAINPGTSVETVMEMLRNIRDLRF